MQKNPIGFLTRVIQKGGKRKMSLMMLLSIATIVSGVFIYKYVTANVGIVAASGGTNISLDTTSASGGNGTFTTLGNVTIAESATEDIKLGTYKFSLPTGWEFDTNSIINMGTNGTRLRWWPYSIVPNSTYFSFEIERTTVGYAPESFVIQGLRVRPTGQNTIQTPNGDITLSECTGAVCGINGITIGVTSLGSLSAAPGAVHHLKVTTDVGTINAGGTVNATVRAYDQFDNLVSYGANNYTGAKNLTFYFNNNEVAAAHQSPNLSNPTTGGSNLGVSISVNFTTGESAAVAVVPVKVEGPFDIDVTSSTDLTSTGNESYDAALTVSPANLNHLIVGFGGTIAAGTATTTTVIAQDAFNNVTTKNESGTAFGASETISITSTATASLNNTTPSYGADSDLTNGASVSVNLTTGQFTTDNLTLYKAESGRTVTITHGAMSGTSAAITIQHAAADHLIFSNTINGQTAGTPFTLPTLNAVDLYGNLADSANGATGYNSTDVIAYTLSGLANGPTSGTDASTTPVTFANGTSTTALITTLYRAQSTTITAHSASLAGTDVASNFFTVNAATASLATITQAPANSGGTVDNPLTTQPIITVTDAYGNTNSNGQEVTAVRDAGTGNLRNATTTTVGGIATFTDLGYSKSGETFDMVFQVGSITSATSSPAVFVLNPGAITSYAVSAVSSPQVAGAGFSVSIQGKDQFNNNTANTETVNITTGIIDAGLSPITASVAGGTVTIDPLTLTKTATGQTIIFTGATSNKTGTSNAFNVNPAVANHFEIVDMPSSVTAGATSTITVKARDLYNNIDTAYAGTIVATSTDSLLTSVIGSFTNGTTSVDINLKTAGTQIITISDNGNAGINGSQTGITVNPAAPASATVTQQPVNTNGTVDSSIQQQPIIAVKDAFNNSVSDGIAVTASLISGTGSLRNTATTTLNGLATFTQLGYSKSGETFQIRFTVTGGTNPTVDANTVATSLTPGAVAVVGISGGPATITAGTESAAYTATSTDMHNNNVVDTYTWSVTPGTGTANLNVDKLTGQTVGIVTMTATSISNAAVNASVLVTVNPAPIDHYVVTPSTTTVNSGETFTVTVVAKDILNNTVTTDSMTVATTTSSGSILFDGDADGIFGEVGDNQKVLTNGTFTIVAKDNAVENNIIITADDATPKTGASDPITVNALTTVYVRTDGNDTNSGAANNAANAKLTIQAAVNAVAVSGTVNVVDGTYNEDIYVNKSITLTGNTTTPANVVIKGQTTEVNSNFPSAGVIGSSLATMEINANSVHIQGFTVETPNLDDTHYAFLMLLNGSDIEINSNTFNMKGDGGVLVAAVNDHGPVAIQTWTAANGGTTIANLNIHNNIFKEEDTANKLRQNGYYGVYLNVPSTEGSGIAINSNNFSGRIWRAITTEHSGVTIQNNTISTTNDLTWLTNAGYGKGITLHRWAVGTLSNVTIQGNSISGAAGGQGFQYGVILGYPTSTMTLSTINVGVTGAGNGNTISNAKTGVLLADAASLTSVAVSNNAFTDNAINGRDDTAAGGTWSNNNWSNFTANANYPTTYLVAGTKASVDSDPVGKLDATASTVAVNSPVTANNTDTATVTITAIGNNSVNLLAGIPAAKISFTVSGTNNATTSPSGTDGSGVSTATIKSTTAETKTITVTIDGIQLTSQPQVVFNPGALDHIAFTAQPATGGTAGALLSPQPVVTLYDVNNNILTTDTTTEVYLTAVLATDGVTPAETTLSGTVTTTVINGVATFSNVSYTKVDNIKLKAVTNPGAVSVLSGAFQNVPSTASYLTVTAASGTMTAGQNNELTIKAYDTYNNLASTTYTGAKNLTFSGPEAIGIYTPKVEGTNVGSPVSIAFTNGESNAGAATLVAYKAQTVSVDVSDGTISSGDYDADLIVSPATIAALDISAVPNPLTTAQTSTITVNGTDAYGNIVDDDATQVSFLYSGDSISPAPAPQATLSNGTVTTTMGKTTAGSVLLRVTATGLTEDNITIVFSDGTAPQVSTSDPVLGSTNRDINTIPTLTFSEDMATTTLTGANIKLMKVGTPDTEVSATTTYSGLRQVIITPSASLAYNTQYYFTISASVTDSNGVAFAAWDASNKDAHKFTTEAAETEAPYVANWSPTDNSKDVPVDTNIILNFNEKLDQTGITGKFKLRPYTSTNDDLNVPITVTYNDSIKQIIINPNSNLSYGQQYYIYVVSTLKDLVGNEFGSSWQDTGTDESQHEFTTIPGMTVQVYAEKTDASADNTYLSGWRYRYEMTLNTNETMMQVQFPTGWLSGSGSIATYPNMRMLINQDTGKQITGLWNESLITNGQGNIKSYELNQTYAGQLLNGIATAANISTLDGNSDLLGRQIVFYVFTRIPTSTPAGIYTADYGIQTSGN